MKKSLSVELQYFPSIISYKYLLNAMDVDFSLSDSYRKRTFRNRCIIAAANGPLELSVPLVGGRSQKTAYGQVRLDHRENWQERHWRSIFSAYGKAPWFFQFSASLEHLFSQRPVYLSEWNLSCLDWVNKCLGVNLTVLSAEQIASEKGEGLDFRDNILPSNFMDPKWGPFPRYTQVFQERHGFLPNLSILDFIFCAGRRLDLLK